VVCVQREVICVLRKFEICLVFFSSLLVSLISFQQPMIVSISMYIHDCKAVDYVADNVTLSHLRSKDLQRLHLPCKPQYRETSKCTPVYTQMCLGKVVTLQKSKPQRKVDLDVDEEPLLVLYKHRPKLIMGISLTLT